MQNLCTTQEQGSPLLRQAEVVDVLIPAAPLLAMVLVFLL